MAPSYKGPPSDPDALASLPALKPHTPNASELHAFCGNRRKRNGRPHDAASVPGILRALAVGASHLFTQYQLSSQLSPAIQAAKRSGATFTCSRELDLVDGSPIGVRVTRTS